MYAVVMYVCMYSRQMAYVAHIHTYMRHAVEDATSIHPYTHNTHTRLGPADVCVRVNVFGKPIAGPKGRGGQRESEG
jgi:hypothetical protein